MSTSRPQRSTPPPLPALKRAPTGTDAPPAVSSPNITMPLDMRDIIAACDDDEDERTPVPGPAPTKPQQPARR
jgi:hypothetical protein